MSNLVIGIIAIALIAIVSAATFFHGGDVYSSSKVDAEIARYINQSTQIDSAYHLYKTNGNMVREGFTINTLVDGGYLKEVPSGWGIFSGTLGTPLAGNLSLKEEVCYTANKNAGYEFTSLDTDVHVLEFDADKAVPYCDNELAVGAPCCYQ